MRPIETYPVNIPPERSREISLFQALAKTAWELFPRGLRDWSNTPILIPDLEWWKITDDIDTTTVIVCPKDAYPDGFTILRGIEYDSHIIVYSGRMKGPFDRMSWKIAQNETSTTLNMIAHRVGYPSGNDELLSAVERLYNAGQEVIAPELINGIFVVCCGCYGEAGIHNSSVYGWNMDIPGAELNRRPRVPVQMKSLRDIWQGFSRN